MKRLLFLLVFLLVISMHCFSQDTIKAPNKHTVYCELVGTQKLNGKIVVQVDFGQKRTWGWKNVLVDDNGKDIEFNTMVDAMNYMGEQGWEFTQAYVINSGGGSVYHWLLRKEILEGEDINVRTSGTK